MTGDSDGKTATAEEFAEALDRLEDADIQRLYRLARNRAQYLYRIDYEDLLHEAISRGLSGSRNWPFHVPLIAFLAEVMRSIADEYYTHQKRHVNDEEIDDETAQLATSKQYSTPEGMHYAKSALEAADDFFSSDEEVWTIMNAKAEGYEASEIRAEFNFTEKQYAAALKRIQRNFPQIKLDFE